MALADEVKARYATSRLIQLTNPGDQSASAIDDTFLGYAVTDTQEEFEQVVGKAYDNSDAAHVAAAVRGVVANLYLRMEAPGTAAQQEHERFIESCERLAKVTGRDRLTPKTSSELTPSDEVTGSEEIRPDADRDNFDRLTPAEPDRGTKISRAR